MQQTCEFIIGNKVYILERRVKIETIKCFSKPVELKRSSFIIKMINGNDTITIAEKKSSHEAIQFLHDLMKGGEQ